MSYPNGRIIEESSRHLTLAFLGNHPFQPLEKALSNFPKPDFPFGPIGRSNKLLFLPELKPRVVAEHIQWLCDEDQITTYQTTLLDWLENLGYPIDRRPLLPHITIARAPFIEKEWEEAFEPLPFMITGIHLYESIGNLRYTSIWHHPLSPVFEEFEHTADIAFHIYGEDFQQLYLHGALALSFKYPPILDFLTSSTVANIQSVIKLLNQMISTCDAQIGCPFKAVSHHGKLLSKHPLKWEMIVDV